MRRLKSLVIAAGFVLAIIVLCAVAVVLAPTVISVGLALYTLER